MTPDPALLDAEAEATDRARQIEDRLRDVYGPPDKPVLDPLEELLLTVLSQSTTDHNRDTAWRALRIRFADWEALRTARTEDVERTIRPAGLARQKTGTILGILERLTEEVGRPDLGHLREMSDAEALEYLSSFRGVGVKTAACVLCFSLRRPVLPVDTHVHRMALRLGFVEVGTDAVRTHRALNRLVPAEIRFSTHDQWIRHGRSVCTARRPSCERCPLEDLCPRQGVPLS